MMDAYEDIITLPHYRSPKRTGMPQQDRAAQFAPFSALSEYEAEIAEAGRLTDTAAELMEGSAEPIDEGLRRIRRELDRLPAVDVTYFLPDQRKSGGEYRTVYGRVSKIVEQERCLVLMDGTRIPFDRIYQLQVK